jgi:hypothetical protein
MQSPSPLQVARQDRPLQVEGEQAMATPTMQVPSPSQTLAGISRSAPWQPESRQMVPAGCREQPPLPLHRPLSPQVSAGS